MKACGRGIWGFPTCMGVPTIIKDDCILGSILGPFILGNHHMALYG